MKRDIVRKRSLLIALLLIFASISYAQIDYTHLISLQNTFTPRALGISGSYATSWSNDPQAAWFNPAAAAVFAEGDRIGYNTNNSKFGYETYSGSFVGGFDISKSISIGFDLNANYYNWNNSISFLIPEPHWEISSAIGTALSYHNQVRLAAGINYKSIKTLEDDYISAFDFGVIFEWPIMLSFNAGKFELLNHDMQIDITPGAHAVIRNISNKIDAENMIGVYINTGLYDQTADRKIVDFAYVHEWQNDVIANGFEINLMDLLYFRLGQRNSGSTAWMYKTYGYGIRWSQIIKDFLSITGTSLKEQNLLNKIEFEYNFGEGVDIPIGDGDRWGTTAQYTGVNIRSYTLIWNF